MLHGLRLSAQKLGDPAPHKGANGKQQCNRHSPGLWWQWHFAVPVSQWLLPLYIGIPTAMSVSLLPLLCLQVLLSLLRGAQRRTCTSQPDSIRQGATAMAPAVRESIAIVLLLPPPYGPAAIATGVAIALRVLFLLLY